MILERVKMIMTQTTPWPFKLDITIKILGSECFALGLITDSSGVRKVGVPTP